MLPSRQMILMLRTRTLCGWWVIRHLLRKRWGSRERVKAQVRTHLKPARAAFDGQGSALWQSLTDLLRSSRLAPSHAPPLVPHVLWTRSLDRSNKQVNRL